MNNQQQTFFLFFLWQLFINRYIKYLFLCDNALFKRIPRINPFKHIYLLLYLHILIFNFRTQPDSRHARTPEWRRKNTEAWIVCAARLDRGGLRTDHAWGICGRECSFTVCQKTGGQPSAGRSYFFQRIRLIACCYSAKMTSIPLRLDHHSHAIAITIVYRIAFPF